MKTRKPVGIKPIKARTGRELARLLELSDEDSAAIDLRIALLKKLSVK